MECMLLKTDYFNLEKSTTCHSCLPECKVSRLFICCKVIPMLN